MKKLLAITVISMLIATSSAFAQQKKKSLGTKVKNTAKDVGKGVGTAAKDVGKGVGTAGKSVGNAAKDVGNKTAEVASKGASKVTDQVYKDKTGPDGQTLYIDNHSKYYWVDDKGHHQYVTAAQMKNKP